MELVAKGALGDAVKAGRVRGEVAGVLRKVVV